MSMYLWDEIIKEARLIRVQTGTSYEDLAKELNVSKTHCYCVLHGHRSPSNDLAAKIFAFILRNKYGIFFRSNPHKY